MHYSCIIMHIDMRTTLNIDRELLQKAARLTGVAKKTALVRLGLEALIEAEMAEHREVLEFVEHERLYGHGIGWVDVHLLAAARLVGAALWTLDRPLLKVASALAIASAPF